MSRRPARCGCCQPSAASYLREVGVVHVAAQERHRVGRRTSLAVGNLLDHPRDLLERVLEGTPVLEVDGLPQLLPWQGSALAPRPLGHGLVPRLEVVQARRQQERQRVADQQVLHVAAQLLVHPAHLVVVEQLARVRAEDARGPHVDDHQPHVAEIARVAPPELVGVLVDELRPGVEALGDVQLLVGVVLHHALPEVVLARAPSGRGCRDAGRSSTSPARRRSGRATSRSSRSPASRRTTCSSRRGRRGRRRSSSSAGSRAATG